MRFLENLIFKALVSELGFSKMAFLSPGDEELSVFTGTHASQDPGFQESRDLGIQESRSPGILGSNDPGFRDT